MKLRFLHLISVFMACSSCSKTPESDVVRIEYMPPEGLESKVDLSIFGAFRPGQRLDAVTNLFGEPMQIWTGANRTTYYLYPSLRSNVAIAQEVQVDGGIFHDLPHVVWWTLYAFPPTGSKSFTLEEVLSPDVCVRISAHNALPILLIIQDSFGEESVWCQIDKEGIKEIRWINSASKVSANGKMLPP